MQNSTYYNLKLVEGTDTVNPLIVDVPNYEIIDEQMHNNAVAGVGFATELANASSHAITRENSECSAFRFIATANWKLGDSVTVDGVPVTALLPSGETLPEGAYVINANVLCILTGTNLTIYAERKNVENANEITYNDTTVGSELNKLGSELNKLNSNLSYPSIRTATITNINTKITNNYSSVRKVGLIVIFSILFTSSEQISPDETIFNVDIPNMDFTGGFVSQPSGTTRIVNNHVTSGGLKATDGLPSGTWLGYLICSVREG